MLPKRRISYILVTSLLLITLPLVSPSARRKVPAAPTPPEVHAIESISMRARAETDTPSAHDIVAGHGVLPIEGGLATLAQVETESQKRRKAVVLSMIRFPWKKLGYEIAFLGPRPGYRAMTIVDKRRIEIYMRPGESALLQAYDLAHELGHAFDLEYNDTTRRQRWLQLRGIKSSTPWFGCDGCPDYSTPAGDFAETFALLVLGPGNYHSHMAQPPRPSQVPELVAFCQVEIPGGSKWQPRFRPGRASLP